MKSWRKLTALDKRTAGGGPHDGEPPTDTLTPEKKISSTLPTASQVRASLLTSSLLLCLLQLKRNLNSDWGVRGGGTEKEKRKPPVPTLSPTTGFLPAVALAVELWGLGYFMDLGILISGLRQCIVT